MQSNVSCDVILNLRMKFIVGWNKRFSAVNKCNFKKIVFEYHVMNSFITLTRGR